MGCGSSKSAVAVLNAEAEAKKPVVENFVAKSSPVENKQNWDISVTTLNKNTENDIDDNLKVNSSVIQVKNAFVNEDLNDSSENAEIENRDSNEDIKLNNSNHTLNSVRSRDKSALSAGGSMDSGVFDDAYRNNSGRSQRSTRERFGSGKSERMFECVSPGKKSLCSESDGIPGKPPSGKKSSSARKKLLRLEDGLDIDETSENGRNSDPLNETITPYDGQNMTLRPKSRFGNLAFDIVLDTPETGNAKKRPDRLAALSTKQKRPKKVKTRKDIDKKMEEAAARRKIQEDEKLLKAKQFQHFAVSTPVEVFQPDNDDEDDDSTIVHRIHSAGKEISLSEHFPPHSNGGEKKLKERFPYDANDEVRETLVEPFRLDSEDEDGNLSDKPFLDRGSLPAVVAY